MARPCQIPFPDGMEARVKVSLDAVDHAILRELQSDARLSYSEIGRRVHISTPTAAERIRRMERDGVITGYHATVDANRLGWDVRALVRMTCYGSTCLLDDPTVSSWPEILRIDRLTGEECCELTVVCSSMTAFSTLIDRLKTFGTPQSSIVLSSIESPTLEVPPSAVPGR